MGGSRIAKLASELNVGLNTIADFLARNGYGKDWTPNSKIDEHICEMIRKAFSKDKQERDKYRQQQNKQPAQFVVGESYAKGNGRNDSRGNNNKYQKETYALFEKYISVVASYIAKIKEVDAQDYRLRKFKATMNSSLYNSMKDARNEQYHSQKSTVWDSLVIAFFGVTNAGKSTIIETFRVLFDEPERRKQITQSGGRGVDGSIVGTGINDYTKECKEYHLKVNGKPFTLIDVPGIEGNEKDLKEEIKKAIHKAHVVLYIQGENKKADSETANKIRSYLSDWVRVYSIYNVKSNPAMYRNESRRQSLLTDEAVSISHEIEDSFKHLLGSVYAGNITIHALLAMCAKAKFVDDREDLIGQQKKALEYFGGEKSVFEFSEFRKLTELIESKTNDFRQEIANANKQKLISIVRKNLDEISNIVDTHQQDIKMSKEALFNFRTQVSDLISSQKISISNKLDKMIDAKFDRFKEIAYDIIDSSKNNKESAIQRNVEHLQTFINQDMERVIDKSLEDLKYGIIRMGRKLPKLVDNESLMNDFQNEMDVAIQLDVTEGLSKMDISLGDVWDFASTVGGAALTGAGVGGPWGAGIGAGIGLIVHLIKCAQKDGGKGEAKSAIAKEISKCKQTVKSNVRNACGDLYQNLDRCNTTIARSITKETSKFGKLSDLIDEMQQELDHIKNTLNSSL